jgi:hypothetical protein
MTPNSAHEIKDELEATAEDLGRQVRKFLNESPEIGETASSLAAAIRKEPVKASLVAIGVGFVLGILFRR